MFFEGLSSGDIPGILAHLDQHLIMLPEKDQEFVRGSRMSLEAGGVLTAQNQAEIRRIAATLVAAEHNTMDTPISTSQMLKDLGSAVHMLTDEEKRFVGPIARKLRDRVPLTAGEMHQLLKVHADKGF